MRQGSVDWLGSVGYVDGSGVYRWRGSGELIDPIHWRNEGFEPPEAHERVWNDWIAEKSRRKHERKRAKRKRANKEKMC